MRAMILLGLQGGFGGMDLSLLEFKDINLETGWIVKSRRKTAVKRRTPLWPETIKAIKAAIAKRPAPKDEADSNRVFITKYGGNWTPTKNANPIAQEFGKLRDDAGIKGRGKSFYTLRHVFQTIGDQTKDFLAVSALMGHKDNTISAQYRETIEAERLVAVVNHVRKWFNARPKKGGAK